MSDMYNSEEQYQDPVPPHEVAPVDGPPPPPPPPADVAPDVAPPAPPAPPAEVAPPAPPVDVAPPAPPADPYAGEVVPTDPGMPPDLPPDAPPPPPVTGHEGHSYEDPSAVIGAGQPGGPPAYEPVVEQQADEVMQEIEELPEAPPAAPSEPDQQPWLDMGSDAEPVDYGDQQPWPDMGSDAGYVSLDPVELSGCAGMCQQVSGEYEDVAAQLTVTPQLESFAPSLIDTLEALRQSLQALAGELSGEAGNLQQAGNVVQDDGSLPLSSYSAPAFGDSAASAAWGSGSDASAVIGAGQPGGPAAAPVSFDPNIAVVGGNPFGEVTIVDGGGGSDYGGLLNALQGNTVVGGNWSSSPTDYTFTLSDNYDYAAGLANAEASLNASGYMSDVTALLNTPRAPMSVNDIILNNIGLQGIRTMNQSLFGTYSLFPPTPSPFF